MKEVKAPGGTSTEEERNVTVGAKKGVVSRTLERVTHITRKKTKKENANMRKKRK